jgi:hypothetical protein
LNKKVSDKPGVFLNTKEKAAVLGLVRRCLKDGSFIQRSHEANQEYLEYIQKSGEEITHSSAANSVDPSGAGQSHGDRVISDALAMKCCQFLGKLQTVKGQKSNRGDPPHGSYAGRQLEKLLKKIKSKRW